MLSVQHESKAPSGVIANDAISLDHNVVCSCPRPNFDRLVRRTREECPIDPDNQRRDAAFMARQRVDVGMLCC